MFHTPKNVMALYLTTAFAVASQPALSAMFTPNSYGENNPSQKVNFGSPLVDAADYGDNNMLKALLKSGQDPNQRGDFETTALLRAAYQGNIEGIKALLLAGADPNLTDIGGATPLHVASRKGHTKAVDLLLKSGATINVADAEGYTPLMRATIHNEQGIFNDLIAQGADIGAKTELGETVVEQAAKTKNTDMVNKLLAMDEATPLPLQVADISKSDANADQISELTPASAWAEAISSQLFGSEFMLMAIADSNVASKGSFNMLDFGSYKSEEEAKKKLEELKGKHTDALKGLNVVVVEKTSGDSKVYHINAGLLDTKEEAVERCKSLVSKSVVCRPVETKMMVSELTKPKAAEPALPKLAEAAPSPVVEKAELPALEKFHAPKESSTEVAKTDAIDAPLLLKANPAKADAEKKTPVASELPVIVKETPKQVAAADVKTEVKTDSNIGKFDLAKDKEQTEEESFFGSIFGDGKAESETKEVAKLEKLEVLAKPVAAPELPKLATPAAPKAELPKLVATPAPAEIKVKQVEPKQLTVKDADKNAPTQKELAEAKAETALNPLVVPKQQVRKDTNKNPFKLTGDDTAENTEQTLSKNKIKQLPKLETSKTVELKPLPSKAAIVESKAEVAKAPERIIVSEQASAKTAKAPELPVVASTTAGSKMEISVSDKKASDALKPLPSLSTIQSSNTANLEEPRISLPKPTPGATKAAGEELALPNNIARTEVIAKAVAPAPAAPAQIPVIASANPAPVIAYAPQPVAPAPMAYAPPQPIYQPAPVQHVFQQPVQQQAYIPAQVPVPPANTSVVVTRKQQPQQIALAPIPAPVVAPQPVAPVIAPAYNPAPVPLAPVSQTPIATSAPNPFVSPTQVVVSKNGNLYSQPYSAPQAPGYLTPPVNSNPMIANNIVNPQPIPNYYPQPTVQMQYQQPQTERAVNEKELWVNVGYFTTQSAARGFWNRISANNANILPKFRMKTKRPAGNGGRVTAEIGPIYNGAEANNVCNIVSTEGLACEITSSLRNAGSTDRYRNFIAGQRHSDLSAASGDYGTVGDEIANGSYNSWSIQLGTFDSKDAARNTWEMLQQQNRALSKMDPSISSTEASSRLRLRAGKFTSTEAAQNVCEELRRNFVSCIIVRS